MIGSTKRTLILIALTGTTLSGCAVFTTAGDHVWSGTKSVARFVITPVRYLLRDAPEAETQFAENSVPVTPLPEDVEETQTGTKAAPLSAEITSVADAPVMGRTVSQTAVAGVPITSIPAGTMSAQTYSGPKPVEILETVQLSPGSTMDILSVGEMTYVRTEGRGSLDDWRRCDREAGGYWTFEGTSTAGMSNPAFERCMAARNYVLESELTSETGEFASASLDTTPLP